MEIRKWCTDFFVPKFSIFFQLVLVIEENENKNDLNKPADKGGENILLVAEESWGGIKKCTNKFDQVHTPSTFNQDFEFE